MRGALSGGPMASYLCPTRGRSPDDECRSSLPLFTGANFGISFAAKRAIVLFLIEKMLAA